MLAPSLETVYICIAWDGVKKFQSTSFSLRLANQQPERYHPTRAARVGTPGLNSELLAAIPRGPSSLGALEDLAVNVSICHPLLVSANSRAARPQIRQHHISFGHEEKFSLPRPAESGLDRELTCDDDEGNSPQP